MGAIVWWRRRIEKGTFSAEGKQEEEEVLNSAEKMVFDKQQKDVKFNDNAYGFAILYIEQ